MLKFLLAALIYIAAFIAAPVVLFLYGNGRWALMTLILNLTVIGAPVASVMGVVGTYKARHAPSIADQVVAQIANASVTHN
jgi:hypothetical protein